MKQHFYRGDFSETHPRGWHVACFAFPACTAGPRARALSSASSDPATEAGMGMGMKYSIEWDPAAGL